jgi:quercetin dioxygenase-like cupin family protein
LAFHQGRTIAKGDFILVPENTPHWFSSIDGVLVLISIPVPRP